MSSEPFSLSGKTILVTGASSGIGRQAAITCAAQGATLVISGRNPNRLGETLDALGGGAHRAIAADLEQLDQIHALAAAAGSIDGLFFSAGIAAIAPFRLISPEHLRKLMCIDFEAPILLTQRLLKHRQVRDGGSIVFNTTVSVHISPAGSAIYAGAKAALHAAARSLSLEVARARIRVTCLQLGYVKTGLLDGLASAGMDVEEMAKLAPLGLGTVEDAANAAVFLLADASRWMSRTALTADGGISLRIT